jgi:uncharacterized protein with PhoU and TrkA domain
MTATQITVSLPTLDTTQSIEVAAVTPADIAAEMVIKNALKNKNNSLAIVVTATTAGTITIKAGNNYPNKILGDLPVTVATGTTVIRLQDISRFENRDGSINLTNATTEGKIFATAKRAGITPVV